MTSFIKNDSIFNLQHTFYNENLNVNCEKIEAAVNFLSLTREINILTTLVIIIIGLIGNILAVIVFIQKKFRKRSSEVFLLVLAITNGLFLLVHFFEDTVRTYIDFYIRKNKTIIPFQHCNDTLKSNSTEESIFLLINITDKFDFSCRLVNYFRYFLRFISAYLITIFTVQRAIVIHYPLCQSKFSSPKFAWKIVIGLVFVATFLCSIIPFLFKLTENDDAKVTVVYCDADKKSETLYFTTTIIYIFLIMFIPITTIIGSNSLIIYQIFQASKQRKKLFAVTPIRVKSQSRYSLRDLKNVDEHIKLHDIKRVDDSNKSSSQLNNNQKHNCCQCCDKGQHYFTPQYIRLNQKVQMSKLKRFQYDSQRVTRMLVIMSLSFAFLNLPYFITWCMFYYNEAFKRQSTMSENSFIYSKYLFGFINVSEVFYVLNYGIHFFLYCASGRQFRKQLKLSFFTLKKSVGLKLNIKVKN